MRGEGSAEVRTQAWRGLDGKRGPGYPPARPQEGGVQEVWPVGGSDHKHILSAMEPIQLSQELRHHSVEEAKARESVVCPQAAGASL